MAERATGEVKRADEYPGQFPARRYQGQTHGANMRAAQTVREAVAKHMKPGQIASGITGEAARKRNRRRLEPDPVRLVGSVSRRLWRSAS